ncbi:MAG: zf-TFIIB domain-containing protein [Phycisphaerae bacterium]|nr:zf-TFIIB domain-containing protein [Phycisphaerae bacterium]
MNCPSCGAAMTFIDGRGYFVCKYCTAFHFPEHGKASSEGVKRLDEKSDRACPVCHLPLLEAVLEGNRVLYCERCRGILVNSAVFVDIIRIRRARYQGPVDRPLPLDKNALKRHIQCPACEGLMDVHPYYGPGNAVIDTCARCGLIWLDHGELGVIERAPGARPRPE